MTIARAQPVKVEPAGHLARAKGESLGSVPELTVQALAPAEGAVVGRDPTGVAEASSHAAGIQLSKRPFTSDELWAESGPHRGAIAKLTDSIVPDTVI